MRKIAFLGLFAWVALVIYMTRGFHLGAFRSTSNWMLAIASTLVLAIMSSRQYDSVHEALKKLAQGECDARAAFVFSAAFWGTKFKTTVVGVAFLMAAELVIAILAGGLTWAVLYGTYTLLSLNLSASIIMITPVSLWGDMFGEWLVEKRLQASLSA